MTGAVKRTYRSPQRDESAARTRDAIRDAAEALFLERGVAATSVRRIAEHAGVGERTVYDAFGTKQALFERLVGVAIVGDERPVPVADRDEFRAALTAPDGPDAVARYAAYGASIMHRAGRLLVLATESAGADAAMRRFDEAGSAALWDNVAAFVDHLVDLGALAGDRDDAVLTVVALSAPHSYEVLRRSGLGTERYQRWLEDVLTATLLRSPSSPPSS